MGFVDLFTKRSVGTGKHRGHRQELPNRTSVEKGYGLHSSDNVFDNDFLTREELMELPAKELRGRCYRIGLDCSHALEKKELVHILHDHYRKVVHQSSTAQCQNHPETASIQYYQKSSQSNKQDRQIVPHSDETVQMLELLEQALPYFGQGDIAIDNTVKDTIDRLPYFCLESRNGEGNTLLMMCCQIAAIDLVPILLSKGSDPNALNNFGESCLHFTTYSESFCPEAAKILVQSGASAEVVEQRFGCTPLHYAASMGEIDMCRILLDGGANPNTVDGSRINCIEYAAQSNNQLCVDLLMRASVSRPSCHVPSVITDDLNQWERLSDQNGCIYFCHRNSGESMWAEDFIRRREILSLSIPNIPEAKDARRLSGQGNPPFSGANPNLLKKAEGLSSLIHKMEVKTDVSSNHPGSLTNKNVSRVEMKSKECFNDDSNDRVSELSDESYASEAILTANKPSQSKSTSKHLLSQNSFIIQLEKRQDHLERQFMAKFEALESKNNISALSHRNDTDESNPRIQELKENLRNREKEVQMLQEKVNELITFQAQSKRTTDKGFGDDDVFHDMVINSKEIQTLQAELSTRTNSLDQMNKRISSLQFECSTRDREYTTLLEKYERCVSQSNAIENLLAQEREAKNEMMTILDQTRKGTNTDAAIIKSLEEQKTRDESTVLSLKEALDDLEKQRSKEIEDLTTEINALQKELLRLNDTVDEFNKMLEKEKVAHEIQIRDTEESHRKELKSLKQNITTVHRSELDDLKIRLNQEIESRIAAEKEKDDAITESREAIVKKLEAENHCERMANMIKEAKTLITANEKLHRSLQEEIDKRKILHNKIEDMKGRIRVYVRIRPLSTNEISKECAQSLIKEDKRTCVMLDEDNSVSEKAKSWEFDQIFSDTSEQVEVFEDTKALITSAIDGFNVCIFAYGQTGSGKTFTMFGPSGYSANIMDNNAGIAPRIALELFRLLESRESGFNTSVVANMFELYNDNLRDLIGLEKDETDKILKIKLAEHSKSGLVEVEGAQQEEVSSAAELMALFQRGTDSRSTSSTNMNADSSRSHLITSLVIKLTSKRTGASCSGKLTLVDLAGSERLSKSGATGKQLKEAQSINKSLSALGDVINALTTGSRHVPYRNNPLTMLMSDSMGGNAKTLMFVCCSPADYNKSESSNSLDFAQRCKCVTNKVLGAGVDQNQVEALKSELSRLKKQNHGHTLSRRLSSEPRRGPGKK